jgi:hypothetical protein
VLIGLFEVGPRSLPSSRRMHPSARGATRHLLSAPQPRPPPLAAAPPPSPPRRASLMSPPPPPASSPPIHGSTSLPGRRRLPPNPCSPNRVAPSHPRWPSTHHPPPDPGRRLPSASPAPTCNTLILLKTWLYKNLLETILLLKEYKVVLFNFRHLKPFLK